MIKRLRFFCRHYLTLDATKALVHAYVTFRLDYCNSLLLGLAKKSINKLQCIQNVAARVVMGGSKEVDSNSLLHHLHRLPIWKRIIYKILLLMFKAINGSIPEYLMDLHPPLRITSKHTQSSCAPQFLDTKTFSKFGDRCFQNSVPKVWNKLLPSLRMAKSLTSWEVGLRTFLFELESPVYFYGQNQVLQYVQQLELLIK